MNDILKRDFHLSDVLSVTTGRLVSTRHMDGVYDIMGFVTGDPDISTIGLVMQAKNVKAEVLAQHPQLKDAEATFPNLDRLANQKEKEKAIAVWLGEQVKKFGETLEIRPAKVALALSLDEQIDYVKGKNPNIKIAAINVDDEPHEPKKTTRKPKPPGAKPQ